MPRIFITISFVFIANFLFSQENIGKVKIDGAPVNAVIKLEDSILNQGKIYFWQQGLYKLQISAEGYETLQNSYFQVYKNRLNSFDYKLKKYREPKLIKTGEFLSPVVIIPLTYLLANSVFPISSLEDSKTKIENQKLFVLQAKKELETNNWQNDISINQHYFEEKKEDYERAVREHNELVKKNNRNRIITPVIVGLVTAVNLIYIYEVYKKRKRARNDIGFGASPNHFALSIGF